MVGVGGGVGDVRGIKLLGWMWCGRWRMIREVVVEWCFGEGVGWGGV